MTIEEYEEFIKLRENKAHHNVITSPNDLECLDHVHICDIDEFISLLVALRDEVESKVLR